MCQVHILLSCLLLEEATHWQDSFPQVRIFPESELDFHEWEWILCDHSRSLAFGFPSSYEISDIKETAEFLLISWWKFSTPSETRHSLGCSGFLLIADSIPGPITVIRRCVSIITNQEKHSRLPKMTIEMGRVMTQKENYLIVHVETRANVSLRLNHTCGVVPA